MTDPFAQHGSCADRAAEWRMFRDPKILENPTDGESGSHDPHDTLADLFLGELGNVAAHDAAVGISPRPATVKDPSPPVHVHAAGHSTSLTQHGSRHTPPARQGAALLVEALVLGHLPVTATAWASQYARTVSEQIGGKVGILRLRSGQARIELAGSNAGREEPGDIDSAMRLAAGSGRVVAFADAQHEAALVSCSHVSTVTLLCSADEAGVVDAYRTLKAISDLRDWMTPGCRLQVSVMGAPEPRARFALSRLTDAAAKFLNLKVEPGGIVPRIEGGSLSRTLWSGASDGNACDLVSRLIKAGRAEAAVAMASAEPVAKPVATKDHGSLAPDEEALHEAMLGLSAINPSRPGRAMRPQAKAHDTPDALSEPSRRPTDAAPKAPVPTVAADGPAPLRRWTLLSAHLPDLTPIAARCPVAEEIEMALDEEGRLHLIAGSVGREPEPMAIERLTAALAWAKVNLRVLAMTLPPGCELSVEQTPETHLLTTTPRAHRPLLDSPIRVHLLAPVIKQVSPDWVCAALN